MALHKRIYVTRVHPWRSGVFAVGLMLAAAAINFFPHDGYLRGNGAVLGAALMAAAACMNVRDEIRSLRLADGKAYEARIAQLETERDALQAEVSTHSCLLADLLTRN